MKLHGVQLNCTRNKYGHSEAIVIPDP